jgi:hypothetical protein
MEISMAVVSRRETIGLLVAAAVVPPFLRTPHALATTSGPPRNHFLSADKYGTTHFDPAQTDSFPYPAPRGTFSIDLRKFPRIVGGPVNFMQLASTSQQYMWATSTGGMSYVEVANGAWRQVAHVDTPSAKPVSPELLDKVWEQRFTTIEQAEQAIIQDLGLDLKRLMSNVYMFVDNDNVLYANSIPGQVVAYGLVDPANPAAGIKVLRTLDLRDLLKNIGESSTNDVLKQYGALVTAAQLTYDGMLVVGTSRSISVTDRNFAGPLQTVEFSPDEYVSNSIAVDENGGIYVAGEKAMHKLVWTGSKLSEDEGDGAWASPYDTGREPPSVKFGRGTGSTPTLMGFGDDTDKLVVITDGSDRMKIVAFWRDQIPDDFKQKEGTKSRRIAGQFQITCGLDPLPEFIQSEQSVVVNGYGAFVVNNIRAQGHKDKLVDVVAGGPVFDPPIGCERVEWDPKTRQWGSAWTRNDVVGTSMVPAMSSTSGIAFVNGYTKKDGWELTGMDWNTGETVHRSIFGQDNLGNGAYALIQFLENGDLLFNSIGGPIRVSFKQ